MSESITKRLFLIASSNFSLDELEVLINTDYPYKNVIYISVKGHVPDRMKYIEKIEQFKPDDVTYVITEVDRVAE